MASKKRLGIIGLGGMARYHMKDITQSQKATEVAALCETSPESLEKAKELFSELERPLPPNEPDLDRFLERFAADLDGVFILTPHVYHHDQTKKCLEAGLDVLLEKPMVMNAAEAQSLIETRDRTGRLLVVGFQGGLSPAVRKAVKLIRSGEIGPLLSISGTVWQSWGPWTVGRWRQDPLISGGGFMFDTGAHMMNTVCDLAGEDFEEVAAWLDNRGRPVDVLATVMGRLRSGAYVTIHGCGETKRSCASEIYVFCTQGIIRTGQWGERFEIQRDSDTEFQKEADLTTPKVWDVFLQVQNGEIPNPCPPEVGLRMARLWDAIKASAAKGGAPVRA